MTDARTRARRLKWLQERFGELGMEVPEHVLVRAQEMTRNERRAVVAAARRAAGLKGPLPPVHPAARPTGLSDREWMAQQNAAKRERKAR
jgi:hypothetical protein